MNITTGKIAILSFSKLSGERYAFINFNSTIKTIGVENNSPHNPAKAPLYPALFLLISKTICDIVGPGRRLESITISENSSSEIHFLFSRYSFFINGIADAPPPNDKNAILIPDIKHS